MANFPQFYRSKASEKKLIYILSIKCEIRELSAQESRKRRSIHCPFVEHDCIHHMLKWVSD